VNKPLLAAAIGISVAVPPAQALPPESPWVLLGIDINMGAVTVRDTTRDADTVSVYGEGLPVFPTLAACQAALRHAIQKYAGLSHAAGNNGLFLCTDWRTWATSTQTSPLQASQQPSQSATPKTLDLDVCLRGAPHDVCGPQHDLVMAGDFMACLSLPTGGWFCRPKGDLYWHDPQRQAAQVKGGSSPADVQR
jgi:hypothetical protein